MKLTANITLDELTKSQIAERKGINNNPGPQQIENLKALAVNTTTNLYTKLCTTESARYDQWLVIVRANRLQYVHC